MFANDLPTPERSAYTATPASLRDSPSAPLYQIPDERLVTALTTPSQTPTFVGSKFTRRALLCFKSRLPPIESLCHKELRGLAGQRVALDSNSDVRKPHHYSLIRLINVDVDVQHTVDEGIIVEFPANSFIGASPLMNRVRLSPNGLYFTLVLLNSDPRLIAEPVIAKPSTLWVGDMLTGEMTLASNFSINRLVGRLYSWLPDSSGLLFKSIPSDRILPDPVSIVPTGPTIQAHSSSSAPLRTYQNLLQNEADEELYEALLQSQLIFVDINSFENRAIGSVAAIVGFSVSPDSQYLLVSTYHTPYSYRTTHARFPKTTTVYSLSDSKFSRSVAELTLAEKISLSRDARRCGPRDISWRQEAPNSLVWVEAQDNGNPKVKVCDSIRDVIFTSCAPFDTPSVLFTLKMRLASILWSDQGFALIRESWHKTKRSRTFVVDTSTHPSGSRKYSVLFDRSSEDKYNYPGRPIARRTVYGARLLCVHDSSIFLNSPGHSAEGNFPFLAMLNLVTKEYSVIWKCAPKSFESFEMLLHPQAKEFIITRETPTSPPNYVVLQISDGQFIDKTLLTSITHPHPEFLKVEKRVIQYTRSDGVPLSGQLYLPVGFKDGDRRPTIIWAYPREFKTVSGAGQLQGSKYSFVSTVSPHLAFVTLGYAVLTKASMPIIGIDDDEPNDTYISQLVDNAEAMVKYLVDEGISHPKQIAIGGHSYGAFMTANLLAHTSLFAVGIARSGAYNRTLTPFGFQSEERTLWECPDTYYTMSPFMNAEKIDSPFLMIHGGKDSNPGTHTMQSDRMFSAMKALGKVVRYVNLPEEGHSYRSRESILHVAWEMEQWLSEHFKLQ